MLRNYLHIALRNLLKSKVFSFVNIFGLAIGMAAFLFIVQYVRFERSYEDFHTKSDNIFRITYDIYRGTEYVVTDCETHAPMGPLLKSKMPEVVDFVRLFGTDNYQYIRIGDQRFLEPEAYFADQSIFNIFSLHVVHGKSTNALSSPFQVVLTSSVAEKYFNGRNPVGESIQIANHMYQVTAVIADSPSNTHLKFNLLLSHPTLGRVKSWYKEDNYNGNNEYTYLLMAPGTDCNAFNEKLAKLSTEMKEQLSDGRYNAEPMKDIHLHSNKTYEPEANGSAKVVNVLLIIAGFIIVIAWVNYINLSTARAVERAREVGIRKVMGSQRGQLIVQFLCESLMVNALGAIIAIGLFQVGSPLFRELSGQAFTPQVGNDPVFWYLFGGLYLAGVLFSGFYPAIVLSSFRPVAVLKGKFKSSSHGQFLRKALVVVQFSATVILMVGMTTVYLQIRYLRSYDIGMNIDQIVVVRAPQKIGSDSAFSHAFQNFKTALLDCPSIQSVTRSESLPGANIVEMSTTSFSRVGKQQQEKGYEYYFYSVDADFIPTMGMKLVAGRNFENGVSNESKVVINETALQRLGFASPEEAIGAHVTFRNSDKSDFSTVIGVLQNFHHRSPKEAHLPMLFDYSEDPDYFAVRIKSDNAEESVNAIRATWDKVFPESVFDYFFLNEQYERQFQADRQFGRVIATFSGLAVFIACLGLFGLSSYTIVQRTKEIGIRKVLGASVPQIVKLLTADFVTVVLIAALIALPVSWFALQDWLSNYAVRINISVWILLTPVIVILFVALATVSVQTVKTALANPTNSLRQE
jgi:putative ABC transport system permease protein